MAYNATYVAADIDDVAIDFVGTYLVQFVLFATIIALAVIAIWFMKRSRGLMPR